MRSLLARLSYANVVASLALFVALGGSAYAAAKLPRGSVSSTTIKDMSVRAQDVHAGAIGAGQIKDKSIGRAELAASVRDGLDGASGARGLAGAPGPAGADGAAGRDGAGIVASRSWGYQTIPKAKTLDLGTITWTQPPNTLDEIRGWATVGYNGWSCDDGEGPTYMLVLDGKEVSPDDNNFSPDGGGTLLLSAPNLVAGASNTTPAGAEAAAEPSPVAQTHTLQVTLGQNCHKNQGGGAYGGPAAVESLRLYVVRNSG